MEASCLGTSSGLVAIQSNASRQCKQPHLASLPFPACCSLQSSCEQLRCSHRRPAILEVRRCKVSACRSQYSAEVDDRPKGGEKYGIRLRRKKLAIFVSGGGSNFRSIHQAAEQGLVHGDVAVLVTDKPGCGGATYAAENGIPVVHFPKSKSSPSGLPPDELVAILRKFEIDFVLLAGYLKLIPIELVQAFPKCILNIHPSLLPAFGGKGFYGMKVHQAVIASGARYSGPTIHFVDENYDTGRILAQKAVPVLANDTADQLAARVLTEEHKLYVDVVSALCEERIVWREDGVPLIRSKGNPIEYM